ncbi:MAG: ATP12 family protein [Roseobacter sp.]
MSEWKAKRFWTQASLKEQSNGFSVLLDGRSVKTPAKRALVVPTKGFAQAIAQEWDAQDEIIDPTSMPFTRSANAALDKVAVQHGEVADMLAAYADSDLLCYRADHPRALVERQTEQWDPILDWAHQMFGTRLHTRTGVMHAPQDAETIEKLSHQVHAMSVFQLAGFHDLVSLSGSLILGLAATRDLRTAGEIWAISRLDEIWQAQEWGADEEAEAAAAIKEAAFVHAKQVFDLSSG